MLFTKISASNVRYNAPYEIFPETRQLNAAILELVMYA